MDDDPSIHQVWDSRFSSAGLSDKINVINFTSPEELTKWHKENHKDEFLYLVDYEYIGFDINGIGLIETLGIESQSILVTSRFAEQHIKDKAETCKGLIPKSSAEIVPMSLSLAKDYDLVLIDDDSLVILTWKSSLKGKNILCYENELCFDDVIKNVTKTTPLYVDVHLGKADGIELATRFHKAGFTDIRLCTGYEADSINAPEFIKKVIGKNPPV